MVKMNKLLENYLEYGKNLRREFHQHPEGSLQEHWTSNRIEEELKSLGIATERPTETGVIGRLYGTGEGRCIALRADIDALELQTQLETDYASKRDGYMHACGHDAHAAGLLYAARVLSEQTDKFAGEVRLLFQPAEEIGQGAQDLISAGALEGVDAIFGIHVWNDADYGTVNIEAGPRMASASRFKITIKGKGGHGALPHQGVDALVVAANLVVQLQTIVSREIDPLLPAVLTVGSFHSGSRFNIMADEAVLEGTTRCFDNKTNEYLRLALIRQAKTTAESYRATAEVEYSQFVIPTINDPELTTLARASAIKLFGEDVLVPMEKVTGGEDFSYYGELVPATFAFVGTRNLAKLENFPHHHPKFDIDEDTLLYSAGLYAQVALDYLNEKN